MIFPTKNYSDYVKRLCSLVGVPVAGLTPDETDFFKEYFCASIRQAWQKTNWLEVAPEGEARLVGNLIEYANSYGPAGGWSATGGAIANNAISNPIDARRTAGLFTEDSSQGIHDVGQASAAIPLLPLTSYCFSVFVRPNGRTSVLLNMESAVETIYALFTLTGSGSVSTALTPHNCTASINVAANGYYLCTLFFTTPANASGWNIFLEGYNSTNTYAGDGTSGFYFWGFWLGQAQNFPANQLIPWAQTGEEPIEAVFEVWRTNKYAPGNPVRQAYTVVPDGIQIINTQSLYWGPYYGYPPYNSPAIPGMAVISPVVFIDYRKRMPEFNGDDYSASATYAVGDSILFEESSGVSNYWTCLVATGAGQSPDTTPASWDEQLIPATFFDFIVYNAYAEWLRQDGQADKANNAETKAEMELADEFDTQERQMGHEMPFKVATHTTSQPRF